MRHNSQRHRGEDAPVQAPTPTLPLDKDKQKEVQFDKALKRIPS